MVTTPYSGWAGLLKTARIILLPPSYFLHIRSQASAIPVPANDTVGGVRASTASLVLGAKHRLRWLWHERRAGTFVYTASDSIDHVFLLPSFVHKMQKGRSLILQTPSLVSR